MLRVDMQISGKKERGHRRQVAGNIGCAHKASPAQGQAKGLRLLLHRRKNRRNGLQMIDSRR
jgi:hypothetical protein